MDTPDRLVYSVPSFVFCIGDENRLDVMRSPLVPADDPMLAPARMFAWDQGMVLAREHRAKSQLMFFGETVSQTYVQPQDRLLEVTDWPEGIELDAFNDVEVSIVGQWARAVMRVSRSSHLGDEPLGGSSGVAGR